VVLELYSQNGRPIILSASPMLLLNTKNTDEVQLDPFFAAANGLQDNEQV